MESSLAGAKFSSCIGFAVAETFPPLSSRRSDFGNYGLDMNKHGMDWNSMAMPLGFQLYPFDYVAANMWLQQLSLSPSWNHPRPFFLVNQARNGWNLNCNLPEVKGNKQKNTDCAFVKSKHGEAQHNFEHEVSKREHLSTACNQSSSWTKDLPVKPQKEQPGSKGSVKISDVPKCHFEDKVPKLEQSFSEACNQALMSIKDIPVKPQMDRPTSKVPVKIVDSPEWLPPGWITEVRTRATGSTAGTRDKYYKDPISGHRFRSRNEVNHYLQTGRISRYKPKHLRDSKDANAGVSSSDGGALCIAEPSLGAPLSATLEAVPVNPQVSLSDTHSKATDFGFVPPSLPCLSREIIQIPDWLNRILPVRDSQIQEHVSYQGSVDSVIGQAITQCSSIVEASKNEVLTHAAETNNFSRDTCGNINAGQELDVQFVGFNHDLRLQINHDYAVGEQPAKEQVTCGDDQAQHNTLQQNMTPNLLEQTFKESTNKVNTVQAANRNLLHGANMAHKVKSFCTNQMGVKKTRKMKLKQEKDYLVMLGRKLCLRRLGSLIEILPCLKEGHLGAC